MHFNKNILAVILLTGCSMADAPHHWRDNGLTNIPASQSAASLWSGEGANLLVNAERHGRTFSLFQLDPFSHVLTLSLPLPESTELILPSQDGKYFIAASASHYAVIQADGTVQPDPLAMTGSLQAVAFSPTAHVALLTDDQQSMVLLQLDATGKVTNSWKTSTKFPNGQYAISGAMLADGTYAAALSGTTIAIVDIGASVTAQAWKARTFDLSFATDMSWTAVIPGLGFNAVLVQDGTRLVVINTDNGTVIDQKSLGSATVLGNFSNLNPHVISQTQDEMAAQKNDVTFVTSAGKLNSVTFQGSSAWMSSTWLDTTAGSLAIAYDRQQSINNGLDPYSDLDAQIVIPRFHMSDGALLDTTLIQDRVRLKLRSNFIFAAYGSALGMAERITYGPNAETQMLTKYTFDVIRARYSK